MKVTAFLAFCLLPASFSFCDASFLREAARLLASSKRAVPARGRCRRMRRSRAVNRCCRANGNDGKSAYFILSCQRCYTLLQVSAMKGFDFSSLSFDFNIFGDDDDGDQETRELLKTAKLNFKPVTFENACDMAKAIDLTEDYFALVSGKFIFGDLLEALCLKKSLKPVRLYVTTLGLSPDNVDSLVNIVDYLYMYEINLIVSSYYAATERNKNIPYMVEQFAGRNINVAVCANHAKLALFECKEQSFLIFGSANLASSNNLEVFALVHDPAVVAYTKRVLQGIMDKWTVIRGSTRETVFENNKGNRNRELYRAAKQFLRED